MIEDVESALENCPICLEEFDKSELILCPENPHFMGCQKCVKFWSRVNSHPCPLCRRKQSEPKQISENEWTLQSSQSSQIPRPQPYLCILYGSGVSYNGNFLSFSYFGNPKNFLVKVIVAKKLK